MGTILVPIWCIRIFISTENVQLGSLHLFRGECTDTLRRRITELETECKKLTMDLKIKEDQIRELELKVQVRIMFMSTYVKKNFVSNFVKYVSVLL